MKINLWFAADRRGLWVFVNARPEKLGESWASPAGPLGKLAIKASEIPKSLKEEPQCQAIEIS